MKSLLALEFKKILKKRQTLAVFLISLFFSIFLAYIPVTFENAAYRDETGNEVILKGSDAIQYHRNLQKVLMGRITPEKYRFAVEETQKCLQEYDVSSPYDLPNEIYSERIKPYAMFVHGVREILADPSTGFAPSDLQINPEEINDDFYNKCENRLVRIIEMEHKKLPAVQLAAVDMYKKVEKPFVFYGSNGNAMDYHLFLSFIILISCTVLVAPIFSSDYQTGAEDILRCAKYGGIRLSVIKIISSVSICTALYMICMTIYICISNSIFGWECTKTSIQIMYSSVSLPNWNIGQLQWLMVLAGLFSVLATISFTLFISSKNKNVIIPLVTGFIICILPTIFQMFSSIINENIKQWIQALLPSDGAGILGSFYYAALDLKFLNIGKTVIWVPYGIVVFAVIELLFFITLTIYSYNQYKQY